MPSMAVSSVVTMRPHIIAAGSGAMPPPPPPSLSPPPRAGASASSSSMKMTDGASARAAVKMPARQHQTVRYCSKPNATHSVKPCHPKRLQNSVISLVEQPVERHRGAV